MGISGLIPVGKGVTGFLSVLASSVSYDEHFLVALLHLDGGSVLDFVFGDLSVTKCTGLNKTMLLYLGRKPCTFS